MLDIPAGKTPIHYFFPSDGSGVTIVIPNDFLAEKTFLDGDLREVSPELVVLVLGPFFERMIVTLITIETNAQKCLAHVLRDFARFAQHPQVVDGRIFVTTALSSQERTNHFVVRHITRNLAFNPFPKDPDALLPKVFAVAL